MQRPLRYRAEYVVYLAARSKCQKTETSRIDTRYRAIATVEPPDSFEQRSIAAVTYHNCFGRHFSHRVAVYLFGCEGATSETPYRLGELSVYDKFKAVPFDCGEYAGYILFVRNDVRSRKKYDSHLT